MSSGHKKKLARRAPASASCWVIVRAECVVAASAATLGNGLQLACSAADTTIGRARPAQEDDAPMRSCSGVLYLAATPKYFVTTVECGSVAEASRKLYIAQPSISTAVKVWRKASACSCSSATTPRACR